MEKGIAKNAMNTFSTAHNIKSTSKISMVIKCGSATNVIWDSSIVHKWTNIRRVASLNNACTNVVRKDVLILLLVKNYKLGMYVLNIQSWPKK